MKHFDIKALRDQLLQDAAHARLFDQSFRAKGIDRAIAIIDTMLIGGHSLREMLANLNRTRQDKNMRRLDEQGEGLRVAIDRLIDGLHVKTHAADA